MALKSAPTRPPLARVSELWLRVLLAVPFLVVIAIEHGLTHAFSAFHGSDEHFYHYPVIVSFGHQLPHVKLHDYRSATTPLFQLTFAFLGKIVGFELARLRLGEALLSYLLVLATYELLRRDVHLDKIRSFVLAAMFAVSPYVFGGSFRLLTDNMAALFAVLALHYLMSFSRTERPRAFAGFCGAAGLAVLTRQLFIWLFPVGGILMLVGRWRLRSKAWGSALLVACVVPLMLLVLSWHGFVPPSFQHIHQVRSPDVRGALFALGVLGVYSPLINTTEWLRVLRLDRLRTGQIAHLAVPLGLAFVGLAIMLIRPIGSKVADDGWLWKISHALPGNLALVMLVPIGFAALYVIAQSTRGRVLVPLLLLFLVASAANATVYQVYYEPMVIVFCLLTIEPIPVEPEAGVPVSPSARALIAFGGPIFVFFASLGYLATR